jgi:hypothetical protein
MQHPGAAVATCCITTRRQWNCPCADPRVISAPELGPRGLISVTSITSDFEMCVELQGLSSVFFLTSDYELGVELQSLISVFLLTNVYELCVELQGSCWQFL